MIPRSFCNFNSFYFCYVQANRQKRQALQLVTVRPSIGNDDIIPLFLSLIFHFNFLPPFPPFSIQPFSHKKAALYAVSKSPLGWYFFNTSNKVGLVFRHAHYFSPFSFNLQFLIVLNLSNKLNQLMKQHLRTRR